MESLSAQDPGNGEDDGRGDDDPDGDLARQRDDDAPPDTDSPDPDGSDDDDDDPEFLQRRVKIKANGVEEEVTIDELRRGYQRHKDYSRKTEAVAAQQRELETHAATVVQQRQALDGLLIHYAGIVNASAGQEPDWDRLYQENPLEFVRQRAVFERRNQELAVVQSLRQQNAQIAAQQHAGLRHQALAQEAKRLFELRPDWKDPVKGKAVKERLLKYGEKVGVPQEFFAGADNALYLHLLAKAMEWDDLVDRARKRRLGDERRERERDDDESDVEQPTPAAPKAPRTAPPGAAPSPRQGPRKALVQAKQRLARTGRTEDAALAIAQLL